MKSAAVLSVAVFLGSAAWLDASVAHAQSAQEAAPSVGVELSLPEGNGVDPAAVQQEVARQLQAPVVAQAPALAQAPTAPSRGTLAIFVSPEGQLTVRWRDAQGREVQRSVPAPADPFEFVRTVGVLAANLANDQVSALLAQAQAPHQQQPPVTILVQVSPATVVSPTPATPPQRLATPPPVVQQPPAQTQDWRALRARQRVSFGLDSYLGHAEHTVFAPDYVESWHSVFGIGGAFVNGHVTPWLRVGAQQISGGPATGGGWYLSAAPYAEANWAPLRWLELYAQLGLGLCGRFGHAPQLAIAPTSTAGARFRIGDVFSIGVGARAAYSLLGDFVHSGTVVSQGDIVGGAGAELAWTVGG